MSPWRIYHWISKSHQRYQNCQSKSLCQHNRAARLPNNDLVTARQDLPPLQKMHGQNSIRSITQLGLSGCHHSIHDRSITRRSPKKRPHYTVMMHKSRVGWPIHRICLGLLLTNARLPCKSGTKTTFVGRYLHRTSHIDRRQVEREREKASHFHKHKQTTRHIQHGLRLPNNLSFWRPQR